MTNLTDCTGQWSGTNKLWLDPEQPARESATTASVEAVAGGGFAMIRYAWADGGKPHDGVLLVRTADGGPADMVWVDSFHTGGQFMRFEGEEDPEGRLSALGSYAAPPGPDWGWRIVLDERDGGLRVRMYNIPPGGEPAPAVDAEYGR